MIAGNEKCSKFYVIYRQFRHMGRVEKHGKIFSPAEKTSGPCGGMAERLKAHVLKTS